MSIRELISRVKPKKGEEKHNKSENTMNSGYTHIFKTMRLFLVEGKPGESPPSGSFFARNLIKRIFFCQNQASKHHTHTHVQHSHTHTHTNTYMNTYIHGVATISRPLENMSLLQNTGLFCRALLQKRPIF